MAAMMWRRLLPAFLGVCLSVTTSNVSAFARNSNYFRSLKSGQLVRRLSEKNDFCSLIVSFEGRSCQVQVQSGETILAALERSGIAQTLCLPEMPADCRRGNCMTCTAHHGPTSAWNDLERAEDGLSPELSAHVAERGYVLTCSSYLAGNGVVLELGENGSVWLDVFGVRLQDESVQAIARAAVAKTIRHHAERNVEEWTEETEVVFQKSGDA
jgi:ferredoxin